jgi:hypothetical protein
MIEIGPVTVVADERDPGNRVRFIQLLEAFEVSYTVQDGPYFQDTIATVVVFPDGGMLTAPHTLHARLEAAMKGAEAAA